MSTAQDDWDDQHRNHELAPKEADTAEPMSAGERTRRIDERLKTNPRGLEFEFVAEQIRQAEQAARLDEREKALEECEKLAADHAEFCHKEAHNGGSHDLYERASGAAFLRDKFRALKAKA